MFISKILLLWEIQIIDDNLLDHLEKPNIVNIFCHIICWSPNEFSFFLNLPTFKWPIVNFGFFKKLPKLSYIYTKKLWTLGLK
jgi:hypothetical protein